MPAVKTCFPVAILIFAAAFATDARAGDGELEINQVCATGDGCFAGDTGGFPVAINEPGSYRLTGNLDIADTDIDAIIIMAEDVTLDLGGFAIRGPVTCDGEPVTSCSPSGSNSTAGRGITVGTDATATLRNGTVRGMDLDGVTCFNNTTCYIDNIRAESNGGDGILATGSLGNGHVRNSFAIANGDHGISGHPRLVTNTIARANAANGMAVTATVLRGNQGIRNGEDGIQCSSDCLLKDNMLFENDSFGVHFLSGRSAYGHNSFRSNGDGSISGDAQAVEIGTNLCATDTTCP